MIKKKKKKINEVVTTRYKMYQLILPDESFQQSKNKQTKNHLEENIIEHLCDMNRVWQCADEIVIRLRK